MFAQAVYVGDQQWDLEGSSEILVTLSEELNIIIPAEDTNPAIYVDVPFDSILEVVFDPSATESPQPNYGLIIQLMSGATTNCFVNAVQYVSRHVALAFASEKDANTLSRLLKQTKSRTNGFLPQVVSQSESIDVSQSSLSDDELAPALSGSQIIMDTDSVSGAIIPHSHAITTINPSILERFQTSQRASAEYQEGPSTPMVEHDEDLQMASHTLGMAEEGFEVSHIGSLVKQSDQDIDISQEKGLSHEESQHRDTQARVPHEASSNARVRDSQALETRTLKPTSRSHPISDTGRSSSQQGLSAFQNAPKSRVQPAHQTASSVKPLETDNCLDAQDGEHDDLYDASPKVKDGPRRSPRLVARANISQNLKRPLESTAPQASVKTGPPIKLSRQLRNADGVVESHTEQTANNDRAGGSKTYANSKKSKTPAPAKTHSVKNQSTKPTKKAAPMKEKGIATKEPPIASLEDFDLPPSPTSMDPPGHASGNRIKENKARTTQPEVTKAPRNNRKQAKPVPAKAVITKSSKGSVPPVKKGPMNKAEANASIQDSFHDTRRGKTIDDDDDAVWDVDQAQSEKIPQASRQSRQVANAATRQEVRAPKTEKIKVKAQLPSSDAKPNQASKAQIQAPIARTAKAKPAPAAMCQPRSRRAAAIKANEKIESLDESDEIVHDDEFVPALMRSKQHASSDAAKTPKKREVEASRDGSVDRSTFKDPIPVARSLKKDSIPDGISPGSSDIQRRDSVAETKAGSSPDKVDLVEGTGVEALEAAPEDKRDILAEERETGAAMASMIPLHSGNGDESNQPDTTSANKDVEISDVEVSGPKMNLLPPNAPQTHESITETEKAHTRPQQNDLHATKSAGSGTQVQVEHDLPGIDDVSHEPDLEPGKIEEEVISPQAPAAAMVDKIRGRRTSPRLAEKAQRSRVASTITKRDPFAEKLNALMSKQTEISPKIKSRGTLKDSNVRIERPNTHKAADLATPYREPEKRGRDEVDAMSSKQAEKPRRHLNTAMQLDGGDGRSLTQTLKSNGESRPASRVEAKRKIEQDGSTSHKRVKLAPQERLEISARRRPVHDSEKTPPPVVSNKPLVIGFSSTGPKNQGTISTKKPKHPKNTSTAAPIVEDSHRHSIPDLMTKQVELGFPSVQEALETPLEHIQHDPKIAIGAQEGARNSTDRKQAENLTKATTAVTRQANPPEHSSQKRKLAPFLDDPAPWEHEQLSKRQKRDIDTPPPPPNHRPRMLPDLSPVVIHDRSQQLSSQNTRVNENGSPMPFVIPRNEYVADEGRFSDEDDGMDALAEARLEEFTILHIDDPVLSEPSLPHRPLVPTFPIPPSKITAYQSLSNNSKQVPSSPHAPSAYGTLPPHHIYHDGEIVNAETKESIIPSIPQDPFLGATKNSKNRFMDALRKSTEVAAQRPVAGVNDKKGSDGMSMRPSFVRGEDPDKTLVEPKVRRKYKQVPVSDSSASSQSGSSIYESESDEPSEEESDTEIEARWRKALEPHQEHMLECLLTISHVSEA